jgi:hypothetical protein
MNDTDFDELRGVSMPKRLLARARDQSSYTLVFFLAFTGSAVFLGKEAMTGSGIWDGWGDAVFFQSVAQIATNSGPIGFTNNLGWPDGFSAWSLPQSGPLIMTLFSFLGSVLTLSSSATLAWTLVILNAINALCVFYFFNGVSKSGNLIVFKIISSVTLVLSPFVLLKLGHLNVLAFFFIPFALGILFRNFKREFFKKRISLLILVYLVGFASPLWWLVVLLAILSIFSFFMCLSRHLKYAKVTVEILAFSCLSLLSQAALLALSPKSNAVTRGVWDSNVFGGRLVDFLLSSPFINTILKESEKLRSGSSAELSQVGIVGAVFGIIAITYAILGSFRTTKLPEKNWWLSGLAIVVTLLFLSGGFGNLQAGVFALFGFTSPARVWSRLIIVLAMIGVAIVLVYFESLNEIKKTSKKSSINNFKTLLPKFVVISMSLFALLDISVMSSPSKLIPFNQFEESYSVEFIDKTFSRNCAVLQLPIESSPAVKVGVPERYPDTYYRGYIPYLISPTRPWSFGDYDRKVKDKYLLNLEPILDAKTRAEIQAAGFCAVLFDKTLAEILITNGISLPGKTLDGVFGNPVFTSPRFDVYSTK